MAGHCSNRMLCDMLCDMLQMLERGETRDLQEAKARRCQDKTSRCQQKKKQAGKNLEQRGFQTGEVAVLRVRLFVRVL